jgi:hypothetical protein
MTHTAKPAVASQTASPDAFAAPLPSCEFRIGEGLTPAHLGQFPNLRLLTLSAIGKAPMELLDGAVVTLGLGPLSLGVLIADAYLKLLRTRGQDDDELHGDGEPFSEIASVIDLMLPLSPKAWATREIFLRRVGEFGEIALLHPERLLSIIANVDALTNARLTERARAIVTTGVDPGADDLWLNETSDGIGA